MKNEFLGLQRCPSNGPIAMTPLHSSLLLCVWFILCIMQPFNTSHITNLVCRDFLERYWISQMCNAVTSYVVSMDAYMDTDGILCKKKTPPPKKKTTVQCRESIAYKEKSFSQNYIAKHHFNEAHVRYISCSWSFFIWWSLVSYCNS